MNRPYQKASRFASGIGAMFACLLCVPLVSCGGVESDGEINGPPNLILIVLDTVRQDRLSAYGYGKETSPRLERFAAEALKYANTYSTSTWTVPAHASMFTGLFPVAHGGNMKNWRLDENLTSLAEILAGEGYETVGVVGNAVIGPDSGFNQGYEVYEQTWVVPLGSGGGRKTSDERTLDWLTRYFESRGESRPLHLFVNLIGAHYPYNSSGEYLNDFVTDPSIKIPILKVRDFNMGKVPLDDDQMNYLNEAYDAELRKVDQILGGILDLIAEYLPEDETMIVVTSDHGENIGDHGLLGHDYTLYETTCRVPLLIKYPPDSRYPAGMIDEAPAQLTDLFPTFLDAAGVDPSAYRHDGLHLANVEEREQRPIFLELTETADRVKYYLRGRLTQNRDMRAVVSHGHKYISAVDGFMELFYLPEDPDEVHNLVTEETHQHQIEVMGERIDYLAERYGKSKPDEFETQPREIDAQTRKELENLGYL